MKDLDGSVMWIPRGLVYGLLFIPLILTLAMLYPVYALISWGLNSKEEEGLFW